MPCVLAVVLVDRACATGSADDATPAGVSIAVQDPRGAGAKAPAYAPGACQAQEPTGASRRRTVFVDAGHGGPDPGVLSQPAGTGTGRAGVTESQATLAVARELAHQLRADGYRVVLSRTQDTSVRRFAASEVTDGALSPGQVKQDLQARVRCANESHAAALLSIHLNGYDDASVGGSQTIYDAARPFASRSEKLARSVHAALLHELDLDDRGVITDDALEVPTLSGRAESYGHLLLLGPALPGWLDQGTNMPGALVEPLFLTAPREAGIASTAAGQRRIATAIAGGLRSYLTASPQ